MNLVINYDFFNAIKDVNEGFTPMKVVRNNIGSWFKFNLPMITTLEYAIARENFFRYMPQAIAVHLFLIFNTELILYKTLGDLYKDKADMRLKSLVCMLDKVNIETTYELLKKSDCYHKVKNFKLNEKKIPQIVESKYVLVPNYDYKGDVIETSILQEHVIGSNQYILSIGSPKKALKLAYSKG